MRRKVVNRLTSQTQMMMLCEKETTSQLHTLFAKGVSVARDYEVWSRELAGHRFRS